MKIYVATVQALRKEEIQDETQFTTKIGEKTSLGLSHFLFIPSYTFMPYHAETGRSLPLIA